MKIKSKFNIDFEFEIQKNSKKKKSKKVSSFLKKSIIWLLLELAAILLDKLVTWVINTFTNGPFYLFNRVVFIWKKGSCYI